MRLRCDVLAHRSTNSPVASQSAGRFADATISTATQPPGTRKKCRDWRGAQPWGVGRFATLQHGDCTVCFVCLLPSYFRTEKLYEGASDLKLLFCKSLRKLSRFKRNHLFRFKIHKNMSNYERVPHLE